MTAAFAGPNPASPADVTLAQSVEHLTFNQVVGGSIPPCHIVPGRSRGLFLSIFIIPSDERQIKKVQQHGCQQHYDKQVQIPLPQQI